MNRKFILNKIIIRNIKREFSLNCNNNSRVIYNNSFYLQRKTSSSSSSCSYLLNCISSNIRLNSFRSLSTTSTQTTTTTTTTTKPIRDESYLFENENEIIKSFEELNVSELLLHAIKSSGKKKPTLIQSKTFEPILNRKDIVLGAETGSGKTLAYLLPIFQRLLQQNNQQPSLYPSVFILVPTKELCQQALNMAQSILKPLGYSSPTERVPTCESIILVDGIWPYNNKLLSPDIVICTPAFLASFIRGPRILNTDLFVNIRTLVIDEADMLLQGSYLKDTDKILEALKVTRRNLIRERKVLVHEPYVQYILSAATIPSHGKLSVKNYIQQHFPKAEHIHNSYFHKHHPRIKQTFIELPEDLERNDLDQYIIDSPARVQAIINSLHLKSDLHPSSTSTNTEKISKLPFTDLLNIDNIKTLTETTTTTTTTTTQYEPTMIFVNTAENAQLLAAALRKHKISCEEYHKLINYYEKTEGFQRFIEGKTPILVCTDAAARGLDIPIVKHVIQAEFALNVIQHLHRIGRASRAGALGHATNFVDIYSRALMLSILSNKFDESIDHSFSRRRGFRKNIKRGNIVFDGSEKITRKVKLPNNNNNVSNEDSTDLID